MSETGPSRRFGLVARETAATLSGVQFLQGLADGTLPAPPFAEVADVWPVEVAVGRVVFAARPSARFSNPMGMVHGGWIALLLDTVMGCAVHSALAPGQRFATIEMKTVFVRPVFESTGQLRAEGVLLHIGGRIASSEGKVFDAAGALVAHGSETCSILTPGAARAAPSPAAA
jgi:uncharacterized protein (TIGR00369 family)